ncbi:possible competence protein F [Psychrobacter arcticus 273-4]|uniref:Possible competence protein F n=1 Tax=Psychrobacter arcticus (strain DSM 17307 / VKM B-2377 / 273-4) TaxID=259536 RepID=Q4FV55_PSYA2|nr:ComF family protein [Psychrobacter arcticus]AAZ18103.1 possible competence protein F [Psychrobacter arcticus 273-4]
MPALASYQSGLWLAEYLSIRCQLCRVYRSTPQSQLLQNLSLSNHSLFSQNSLLAENTSHSLSNNHSFFTNIRKQFHSRCSSGLLCTSCHSSISWLPTPFQVDIAADTTLPIQAATYYDYPMRQAIRAFKHHEDMTKLPLLLHALRQLPRPHGCHQDNSVIVAMPTTDERLIKRGFDPVSILAAHLSKHWDIPLWQGIKRIDNTLSQQGLTRAERLSNLNNAFILIEPSPVKRLILFDDVATTGASLQALARTLSIYPATTHNANNKCHLYAYVLAHGSQS